MMTRRFAPTAAAFMFDSSLSPIVGGVCFDTPLISSTSLFQ